MLDYRQTIDRLRILDVLRDCDPRIAGTLPLGIDVPGSDIDILCHAADADAFTQLVWSPSETGRDSRSGNGREGSGR